MTIGDKVYDLTEHEPRPWRLVFFLGDGRAAVGRSGLYRYLPVTRLAPWRTKARPHQMRPRVPPKTPLTDHLFPLAKPPAGHDPPKVKARREVSPVGLPGMLRFPQSKLDGCAHLWELDGWGNGACRLCGATRVGAHPLFRGATCRS